MYNHIGDHRDSYSLSGRSDPHNSLQHSLITEESGPTANVEYSPCATLSVALRHSYTLAPTTGDVLLYFLNLSPCLRSAVSIRRFSPGYQLAARRASRPPHHDSATLTLSRCAGQLNGARQRCRTYVMEPKDTGVQQKRCRVGISRVGTGSGVLSASLPLLAQEDP
eukprot:1191786-Prorocentrum_minimum.AAC.2